MDIRFEASSIDNSAIYIIIQQLLPFMKRDRYYDPPVLDDQKVTEKERTLYEQVYLPAYTEICEHSSAFHHDCPSESWLGEQACLSMIHAINQRAWWYLYYYAVKEVTAKHSMIEVRKLAQIAREATLCIFDGDLSIKEAVHIAFTHADFAPDGSIEKKIVNDIADRIAEYREAPSHSMVYR